MDHDGIGDLGEDFETTAPWRAAKNVSVVHSAEEGGPVQSTLPHGDEARLIGGIAKHREQEVGIDAGQVRRRVVGRDGLGFAFFGAAGLQPVRRPRPALGP